MQIRNYKFDRVEFAGSLGDLGTLIPLCVTLILIADMSVTSVFLMVGLFYILSGLYFKLPMPVQPLKVVAAIAIAYPLKITLPVLSAAGITFGLILLCLTLTGLIDRLAILFTKQIVRGIQLGLGFILINKGLNFIISPELFVQAGEKTVIIKGVPVNLIIGIIAAILTLFFLSSKRFPAAIILVSAGMVTGIALGAFDNAAFRFGPTSVQVYKPSLNNFINAVVLLVIPQLPLTIGNAVIGTKDTCRTLFGNNDNTKRVTYRTLGTSMGLINIITGFIGGIPMCHGAGGLAAHHRFGARTGGSNIMIGLVFLILALGFGRAGIVLLSSIPMAVLGVFLLFAGLELALLIKDVREKEELFVSFLIAGVGFATANMGFAFFVGIMVLYFIKGRNLKL